MNRTEGGGAPVRCGRPYCTYVLLRFPSPPRSKRYIVATKGGQNDLFGLAPILPVSYSVAAPWHGSSSAEFAFLRSFAGLGKRGYGNICRPALAGNARRHLHGSQDVSRGN